MKPRAPLRYSVIAGLCLLLHNVILIAGSALGLGTTTAVFASFAVVLTFGYLAHCRFTFREPLSAAGFLRYGAAMAANVPLTLAAVWLLHVALRLPMWIAAPVSSAGLIVVNFLLSKWAIVAPPFARRNLEKTP